MLKTALTILFIYLMALGVAYADGPQKDYPMGPDSSLTPGALCSRPREFRYPEKIKYCIRNVDTDRKTWVFRNYDEKLGYSTLEIGRTEFKIDHFIPLCVGGSNDISNLWPQHLSISAVTDPLEELICIKMAEGVLLQEKAVSLVREAKRDLSKVPQIMSGLKDL